MDVLSEQVMQRTRRTKRSCVGEITTFDEYFSGDNIYPSNKTRTKNSRGFTTNKEKRNKARKNMQSLETLKWLSENYELIQGVCVPRCVLYTHYLDFCKKRKYVAAGAATFGKLIRQRFPKLTTRRLGTRGQSKYHYYGIAIKESSQYYHSLYSGKGLTKLSEEETTKMGFSKKFGFKNKMIEKLPEFPKASEMILDPKLSVDKVETFIIMYRTHCQRILDTIMNANFDEVSKFLLHFWQGMPEHLVCVLQCSAVVDVIIICDLLLYKILNDVLVPTSIQDIPHTLTEEIKKFAKTFVGSLKTSLKNTPISLRTKKQKISKTFSRLMIRNMTFINLAQITRPIFLNYESMSEILSEFYRLDLKRILTELVYLTGDCQADLPSLLTFIQDFEHLLVKQAPVEAYTELLDKIIEHFIFKVKNDGHENSLVKKARKFLTSWAFLTSRILEELTLKNSTTFGSFQLIIMMFEEYIMLALENQNISNLEEQLKKSLEKHLKRKDNNTTDESSNIDEQNSKQSDAVKQSEIKCSTKNTIYQEASNLLENDFFHYNTLAGQYSEYQESHINHSNNYATTSNHVHTTTTPYTRENSEASSTPTGFSRGNYSPSDCSTIPTTGTKQQVPAWRKPYYEYMVNHNRPVFYANDGTPHDKGHSSRIADQGHYIAITNQTTVCNRSQGESIFQRQNQGTITGQTNIRNYDTIVGETSTQNHGITTSQKTIQNHGTKKQTTDQENFQNNVTIAGQMAVRNYGTIAGQTTIQSHGSGGDNHNVTFAPIYQSYHHISAPKSVYFESNDILRSRMNNEEENNAISLNTFKNNTTTTTTINDTSKTTLPSFYQLSSQLTNYQSPQHMTTH